MRCAHPVLLALLLYGCATHDATTAPEKKTMSAPAPTHGCVDRIRALVAGDLASGGLPAGCTVSDAQRALGADGTPGSGTLTGLTHAWIKYDRGSDTQIRVWSDGDQVILLDVKWPTGTPAVDALRRALGEPAERMQARVDPTHEEWIYPDRGLTVAVGNSLDDAAGAPPQVSWFAAYAPTTLDDYVKRLGGKDAWVVRRPQRR